MLSLRNPGRANVLFAAGILLTCPVFSAERGSLVHNGVEMSVEAVVAVWDAEATELQVTLLPYEPSADEVKTIQEGGLLIFMHKDKASPDPEKWPDWIPYASYKMTWFFHPDAVGDHDKAAIHLYAFGIGDRNSNLNFNSLPEQYPGRLEGEVKVGGEIHLVAKHEGQINDEKLSWDLNVRAKVLPAVPE